MPTQGAIRWTVTAALVVLAVAALSADTLVMRDGRRIAGELIAVRNGTIEFQERGGYSSRVIRVSRDEVRRIEMDDPGDSRPGEGYAPGGRPGDVYAPGGRPGEGGRPGGRSGMREREVMVRADSPWSDTGIDVRDGQQLFFHARGEVVWGPGRKDGPEGERNSAHNAARPMPNRPGGALIGRVGTGSPDYFYVGGEGEGLRVRGSGRLFLGINDDYLKDNRGYWTVLVYY